jgi:hypothetical protein
VTLVLKEVQVPVALGHGVVGRVCPLDAGHGKAAAGDEINANGQRLLASIKINALDKPRFGNAQGGFKQLGTHASISSRRSIGRACYSTTALASMAGCDRALHPATGQRISRSRASRVRSAGLRPPLTHDLGYLITHSFFK